MKYDVSLNNVSICVIGVLFSVLIYMSTRTQTHINVKNIKKLLTKILLNTYYRYDIITGILQNIVNVFLI